MRVARWFSRLSIAWKINAIVMFIGGVSMVLACMFIAYDAVVVLFGTFWVALALSMRFQRAILRPILDLTALVRTVTERRHDLRGHTSSEQCLAAGMDDDLAKPAESRALFAAIESDSSTVTVPPGPVMPATSSFDLADLERSMGGDQALVREMVRIFLEDCPLQMAAIKAAVDARDAVKIRTTAHALKGSAGYLRATLVFEAARKLEAIGREGALASADALHQRLVAETTRLVDELRKVHEQAV